MATQDKLHPGMIGLPAAVEFRAPAAASRVLRRAGRLLKDGLYMTAGGCLAVAAVVALLIMLPILPGDQ